MNYKGNIYLVIIITTFLISLFIVVIPPFRNGLLRVINRSLVQITPSSTSSTQQANSGDSQKLAVHAFVYANYPLDAKKYLFDAARRTGKKLIRDGFPISLIAPQESKFVWNHTDENVKLEREHGFEIVGILGGSAPWLSSPGAVNTYQGPIDPQKYDAYIGYVKQTVLRYPEVKYWEVWNEPNAKGLYDNNPAEFAKILKLTYLAIKETNPQAQVLFPGVIFNVVAGHDTWVIKLLTDPINPGKNYYDIANVHIRGSIDAITKDTTRAREIFTMYGKANAPFWITEHGYPADQDFQYDKTYNYGEQAQADYYEKSIPLFISLGVGKIFVTLRDIESDNKMCDPNYSKEREELAKKRGLRLSALQIKKGSPFCYEGLVTFNKSAATGEDRKSMSVLQLLE